jgi:hypothetical protein
MHKVMFCCQNMWMAFKMTRSMVTILSSKNSWSCYKVVSSSREQASEVADSDSYVLVTQRNSLYFYHLHTRCNFIHRYIAIKKKLSSRVMGQKQQTYMTLMKVSVLRVE